MDRLIGDGDAVQVTDGSGVQAVQVPIMTFSADTVNKVISGTAPPDIISVQPGSPNSLQISIGDATYQVTTDNNGTFSLNLSNNAYLAGLLGTLRYTTPSGNQVYKPLFAAELLARGQLADWRADTILGQPDFTQITPNEVVGNRIFNPSGVFVDRSARPNRVYIYDAGNSRVLGLNHLGIVASGPKCG